MILLTEAGVGQPAKTIAIFGAGLIGEATARALGRHAALCRDIFPLDWSNAERQERQLAALESKLTEALVEAANASPCVDLLWSAGRAGFGAGLGETTHELASFQAVLALAVRLAASSPGARIIFHLISSAGGLFEGQRQVDCRAVAAPRRPYSLLKQRQEELLAAAPIASRVYRLSSVYGFVRPGQRIGLISILLLNGLRHRVTHINGRMSTLRDFVFAEDIADFLARAILVDIALAAHPVILAHGKPTSIWEIQRLIESVIGRRIYLSYSLMPENSEDSTFSPAVLPSGWRPSDLASNIRRIYHEALRSGAAFSQPQR
ncbi:MAG TPA: NAD-dependent epimerase/dehydratase family protein [Thermoanaerobaculia bacterium]|nr:NAD-dependent epimerase/dehydratase family protein [Thermoanaerobaculia bacterium]